MELPDHSSRAVACMKYLKAGLEHFVDIQVRQQHRNILEYVKKYAVPHVVNCAHCKRVEDILPDHVVNKKDCPYGTNQGICNCICSKLTKACPNNTCGIFYDRIIADHFNTNPSWSNTDPTKWVSDYWELAKCFLPNDPDRYATTSSVADTDVVGLLSICINSQPIRWNIANAETFEQAYAVCKQIAHHDEIVIETANCVLYMDLILDVLMDMKAFVNDATSAKSILSIRELKGYVVLSSTDELHDLCCKKTSKTTCLAVVNCWTIIVSRWVNSLSETLKELVLENMEPLVNRTVTSLDDPIRDIIRLSHSEVDRLVNQIQVLALKNVECICNKTCGCGTQQRDNAASCNDKMKAMHVIVRKTVERSLLQVTIKGSAFANPVGPENLERSLPLWCNLCKSLRTVSEIQLSNIYLSHTHITRIMCSITSLRTVKLHDVICVNDKHCGCDNTYSNCNNILSDVTKIQEFSMKFTNNPYNLYGSDECSLLFFCHIENATNLSDMTLENVHSITSFLPVPKPDSPARIKLVDIELDKGTFCGLVEMFKDEFDLTLKNVKVNDTTPNEVQKILKRRKDVLLVECEEGKNGICANIQTIGCLQRVSPFYAWPAYEYACENISNLNAHCHKVFRQYGVEETDAGSALDGRLFCNVTLQFVVKTQLQERCFNDIFQMHLSQSQYCETSCPSFEKSIGCASEKPNANPILIVAEDKDATTMAKLIKATAFSTQKCNIHVVLVHLGQTNSVDNLETDVNVTFPTGVAVVRTSKKSFFSDVDSLLKEYAFEGIKIRTQACHYLLDSINNTTNVSADLDRLKQVGIRQISTDQPLCESDCLETVAIEDTLKRIYRLLKKSGIPEPHDLRPYTDIKTPKKVIREILDVDKESIVGCGERYGNLHVYVDETLVEAKRRRVLQKVDEVIRRYNTGQHIVVHLVSKTMKKLSRCGSRVGESSAYGTLGGFATSNIDTNLYALVSRHIAQQYGSHLKLCSESNLTGYILRPLNDDLDIAAIRISQSEIGNCDTHFKDERGRRKSCRLFDFSRDDVDIDDLVFINGASTSPGRGQVFQIECEHSDKFKYLVITDRDNRSERFYDEGDSGAIVCSVMENGNLLALGMIIGEFQTERTAAHIRQYIALRLEDGLQVLSENHIATFQLCG